MLMLIAAALLATSPDLKVTTGTLTSLNRSAAKVVVATPSGSVTFDISDAVALGDDGFAMPLRDLVGKPVQVWYALKEGAVAREIDLKPLSPPPLVQAARVAPQTATGAIESIDLEHQSIVLATPAGQLSLKVDEGTLTKAMQVGTLVRATYFVEPAARAEQLEVLPARETPPLPNS